MFAGGLELQLCFSEDAISFLYYCCWAGFAVLLVQLFRGVNDVCYGCSEYKSCSKFHNIACVQIVRP